MDKTSTTKTTKTITRRRRYSSTSRRRRRSRTITRCALAQIVVLAILLLGFSAILMPEAERIFDKLHPALTLVLGYYFRATQERG